MGRADLAGAAHLELVSGVVQLRPEDAMFEAMVRGWRAQQAARGLKEDTIVPRERLVRRFAEVTNEYPWNWGASHVDEWTLSLMAERHLAPSTIRGYQMDLRLFSEYLCDGRYGWAASCEKEFGPGVHPVPVCHERNSIAHLNGYEGNPGARPFTREELQRFLDYADDQVDRAVRARRKGALAAYRDATMFKVIYGWGLRRTETSRLDIGDWGRNPAAAEFGRFGMLHVRYGKAKRGQPPRRRNVASVMAWAADAVADYVQNIRPKFGCADQPALWVTERGGRVRPPEINARFEAYRDAHEHCAAQGPGSRVRGSCPAPGGAVTMARRLDYRWNLRQVMAARGMFATTDLIGPLALRGIRLSSSQVYRLVAERPERLSLKILMALLDILGCSMDDLIEPVAHAGTAGARKKKAAGAEAGVGDLRPRRARIHDPGRA